MNLPDLAANLASPPILCFILGLLAAGLRSDLEFPAPLRKVLSLFLLFALGFKGGLSLAQSRPEIATAGALAAAIFASAAIPLWVFWANRRRLGPTDAAALAATYGSVSAVTFVTATAYLTQRGVPYSGHMIAAMALMESPAIVVGLWLARRHASSAVPAAVGWRHLGRDAFLNGSVFLLLGSLLIGLLAGPERGATLKPGVEILFPVALSLFLLDLGMVAGRHAGALRQLGAAPLAFAIVAPAINAGLGLGLAALFGLGRGDGFLLVVLCASASYIAVPAALRISLPQANPGIYLTLSLAFTFPFNVLFGLPLYHALVGAALPS